jgi:hypothetical protein
MLLQFIRLIILFIHLCTWRVKNRLGYVVLPVIFLIMYLLFILLTEGNYIYEVLKLRRLNGIFNNILIHNKVLACAFFTLNSILSIMKKI